MPFNKFRYIAYQVPTITKDNQNKGIYGIPAGKAENIDSTITLKGDDKELTPDSKARVIRFLAVLKRARDEVFKKEGNKNDPNTLKIFMAPEFYFRPASRERAYSYQEYLAIKDVLRATITEDEKFKHWLVIAGTIMWIKPEIPNEKVVQKVYRNTALYIKGHTGLTWEKFKEQKAADQQKTTRVIEKTMAAAADGVPMVVQSTDKDRDPKGPPEAFSEKYRTTVKRKKHIFDYDGIWLGLEICKEHELGIPTRKEKDGKVEMGTRGQGGLIRTLINELSKNTQKEGIDYATGVELHLLIAAGMYVKKANIAACSDGYFLRIDGCPNNGGHKQTSFCKVDRTQGVSKHTSTKGRQFFPPLIKKLKPELQPNSNKTQIEAFYNACEQEKEVALDIKKNDALYISPPSGINADDAERWFDQEIKIYKSKKLP